MVDKTVNYLCKISDYLDKHVTSAVNVSRFLREKCASKGQSGCIRLPGSIFRSYSICPYCYTPWTLGFYKLKFLYSDSKKKKKKQSLLKLLAKEPNTLNRFQAALVARAKSGPNSSMKIICLKCSKVTNIRLGKIFSVDQSVQISENVCPATVSATEVVTLPKKKKKKKKDRFCGLNQYAVSSFKKVNEALSKSTNSIFNASRNHEFSSANIKPYKHKCNNLQSIEIKSNGLNNHISTNILSNNTISTSKSILPVNILKTTSNNLSDIQLNSCIKLNPANNSVNTSNRNLDSRLKIDLNLKLPKVDCSDVKTNNRSTLPSSRRSSASHDNHKRKENVEDMDIKKYPESCYTSKKGEFKKFKNNCDSEINSVTFQNESGVQVKLKYNEVTEPKVSSVIVATSNKGNNLFSQLKFDSTSQNNKPSNNKLQIDRKNPTDSTSTFQKHSKSIEKNKKLSNINTNFINNKKLNKISISNKLQSNQKDNKNKKKSKKIKMKDSKSFRNDYKVYERTNCTNSLCVDDLLTLT